MLADRATARGSRELLVCDDDVLTYADADRRSAALAKGLLAAGCGKGSHIGLLHPNGSAFVVATLAAARIGAVTLPISTLSTSAELRVLLRNADIEVLLAGRSHRGRDHVADLQVAVPGLEASDDVAVSTSELPGTPTHPVRHEGPRRARRPSHRRAARGDGAARFDRRIDS